MDEPKNPSFPTRSFPLLRADGTLVEGEHVVLREGEEGVTTGRSVHFVPEDASSGESPIAAIVTYVHGDGSVNLSLLGAMRPTARALRVRHSPAYRQGRWSWMPRSSTAKG